MRRSIPLLILMLALPATTYGGESRQANSLNSLRMTMSMIGSGPQRDLVNPLRALKKPGLGAKRVTTCEPPQTPCSICICGCDAQAEACLDECRENHGSQCDLVCGDDWNWCYVGCFNGPCS